MPTRFVCSPECAVVVAFTLALAEGRNENEALRFDTQSLSRKDGMRAERE
jgi:hypothetical protein